MSIRRERRRRTDACNPSTRPWRRPAHFRSRATSWCGLAAPGDSWRWISNQKIASARRRTFSRKPNDPPCLPGHCGWPRFAAGRRVGCVRAVRDSATVTVRQAWPTVGCPIKPHDSPLKSEDFAALAHCLHPVECSPEAGLSAIPGIPASPPPRAAVNGGGLQVRGPMRPRTSGRGGVPQW